MLYVFLVAIALLLLSVIILIYFCIIDKNINKNLIVCISIIIILSLSTIAFMLNPSKSNDLYRHFEMIDIFRNTNFEANDELNEVFGAKILFYIVSFFPSNHLLPVISVLITYGILFYMIKDFVKNKNVSTRCVAISVFLGIAICDYVSVVSGIRNAIAFAFIGLALYKDLIKEERGIKIIWPYIVAVLIHPSSWIVIVVRLILNLRSSEKIKYFLLFWSAFVDLIIEVLFKVSPYIATKLQLYFTEDFLSDFRIVIVKLILIIFIYVITMILNKNKNVEYKKYINFLQLYICSIIGSLFVSTVIFGRLFLLLAFLMIPLIYLIEKDISKNRRRMIFVVLAIFIIGFLAYSVIQVRGNMSFMFIE